MSRRLSFGINLGMSLLVFVGAAARAQEPAVAFSRGDFACTENEKWEFSAAIPAEWRDQFKKLTAKKASAAYGFTDSVAAQSEAKTAEAKLFTFYWRSRAFFERRLVHLALEGFNAIASQNVTRDLLGIQTAALDCLNQIHYLYPSLQMSPKVAENLPNFAREYDLAQWRGENQNVFGEAAVILVQSLIAEGKPASDAERALALFQRNSPQRLLARGLWNAKERNFDDAISDLNSFLKVDKLPGTLGRYRDKARLTLARSYHQSGKYDEAVEQLKHISNDSNYTVRILNELAWSYLMKNKYSDAIGIAVNLQKGAFHNTYTPEALVIMAMAFNEICQFPSSFRSIRFFYRNYRTSHDWLTEWYNNKLKKTPGPDLYKLAVNFVESEKTQVPMPVMSEWLRSPVFISHQEELNLLLDEPSISRQLRVEQRKEIRELAKQAREMTVKINKKLKEHKEENARLKKEKKPPTPVPAEVKQQLAEVKRARHYFKQFKAAMLSFDQIVKNRAKLIEARRKQLLSVVEWDLANRNVRMLSRLRELIETAYLVQVEIYNGASEDIVWKNAHPGYEKFLEKIKKENRPDAGKVLDWGSVVEVGDQGGEIWEDALDSMKPNLSNNSESKDRYLNVTYGKSDSQDTSVLKKKK